MKVGQRLIFIFRDADGFGATISDALYPNPNSSLHKFEESFELSLERYSIRDCKASGNIVHFIDDNGLYQVSVLLLQNYKPPILACAVNEVLASITGDNFPTMPTLVVPFIVASYKLKRETKHLMRNDKEASLYGVQIGPETEISRVMVARTQKPPPLLQVHHEHLACFLQVVRVLKLPTFVLIGQINLGQELEVVDDAGKLLANTLGLSFLRGPNTWNPTKTWREEAEAEAEPWRALYG